MTHDASPSPQTLVDALSAAGELSDPAWRAAFLAVPRHLFVPGHSREDAYTDDALITQTRTAHDPGGGSLELPTSSASAPSVVAAMLDRLTVDDGMRVLEIGTGTGYNAALLANRLGADRVSSIDLDPALIDTAGAVLDKLDYRVHLAATDGYEGLATAAPFDRIIATCAITHVPPAWIRQLAPGGRIVAPLHTDGAPLVVLDKTADNEVTGRFDTCYAAFMPLRPEIDNPLSAGRRPGFPILGRVGYYGTTDLNPYEVTATDADWRLFLALHLPGLSVGTVHYDGQEHERVTLVNPHGYAEIETIAGADGQWDLVQHGRRLYDTAEHAMKQWATLGKPQRSRYGITAAADDPHRQYVWLDNPDSRHAWPMHP